MPGIVLSAFTHINSFNPENKPMKWALLLSLFYRQRNQGTELSNLLNVTQLITGGL